MPTYAVRKLVSKPDARLDHMGARLDVQIVSPEEAAFATTDSSSSSSITVNPVTFESSSSSAAQLDVQNLFLFQQEGDREHFLGVCSPLDLETWPVGSPDATTGLFRRHYVSLTFRKEDILDDLWSDLWNDIEALASVLSVLAPLRDAESEEYEFTETGVTPSSSSSLHALRRLRLQRAPLTAYPSENPVGYRLTVTCTADGADHKIFLHRNDLADRSGVVHYRPIAVCSPGDLVDYPPDAPDEDQFPDHYRLSTFDVMSKDPELLQEAWINIKRDTEQLAAALKFHLDEVTDTDVENVSFNVNT